MSPTAPDDFTALAHRLLEQSRATNAAAYNARHALHRSQQKAMADLVSRARDTLHPKAPTAQAAQRGMRGVSTPAPQTRARHAAADDDWIPDRWLG